MKYDEFYEKEKFHIQRLAQGVREISKVIGNYKQIYKLRKTSLNQVMSCYKNIDDMLDKNNKESKCLIF